MLYMPIEIFHGIKNKELVVLTELLTTFKSQNKKRNIVCNKDV